MTSMGYFNVLIGNNWKHLFLFIFCIFVPDTKVAIACSPRLTSPEGPFRHLPNFLPLMMLDEKTGRYFKCSNAVNHTNREDGCP